MGFLKRPFGRKNTENVPPPQDVSPLQDMIEKIDAYYEAERQEEWNKMDLIGPQIWAHIEKALASESYATEISSGIVHLLRGINQSPDGSVPHGEYSHQFCDTGALKIVKMLSIREALPEVRRLQQNASESSKKLINEVLLHLDPNLEEDIKAEEIERKQQPDVQFSYSYASLKEALSDLEQYFLPNIRRKPEHDIKSDSISGGLYSHYLGMEGHWHAFEGSLDEAYAHLSDHFAQDHPESVFRYTISSNGYGQLDIVAATASTGYQHFVWRTLENKYVLMLSDGT
jgi:hypothetical protein